MQQAREATYRCQRLKANNNISIPYASDLSHSHRPTMEGGRPHYFTGISFKSGLGATQDHWKWRNWINRIRVSIELAIS